MLIRNAINLILLTIIILYSNYGFATIKINRETISSFDSQITINQDSSIDLIERITVNANQVSIKHGIVRWLPQAYTDSDGYQHNIHYQPIRVLLNNFPVPYILDDEPGKKLTLQIGDKKNLLLPGIHTYTIEYHITNAIKHLKDADELYWNITGNNWSLPIENVIATVLTPPGNYSLTYSAYTGLLGQKGKSFSVSSSIQNKLVFKTTSILQPGEGLTIAVALPKNVIHEPPTMELIKAELQKPTTFFLLLVTAITFFYFIAISVLEGPSPKKGRVKPIFEPPFNLSPPVIRYVYIKQLIDDKILTTLILDLAVKGYLTINNVGSELTLTKTGRDVSELPDHEKAAIHDLFANDHVVILNKMFKPNIIKTQENLTRNLRNEFQAKYFKKGLKYFIPAFIVTAIATLITYYTNSSINSAVILFILIPVFCYDKISALLSYTNLLKRYSRSIAKLIRMVIVVAVSILTFIVVVVLALFLLSYILTADRYDLISIIPVCLLFTLITITAIFYFILNKPTVEGRKLLDQIDGFRVFLSTTNLSRLDATNPPDHTPENFEKFLPYAVALNIESEWSEHLTQLIKSTGKESIYNASWYIDGRIMTSVGFAAYIANQLSTTVGSLSDSSSSGKGSSGGGGGGGGGGGW